MNILVETALLTSAISISAIVLCLIALGISKLRVRKELTIDEIILKQLNNLKRETKKEILKEKKALLKLYKRIASSIYYQLTTFTCSRIKNYYIVAYYSTDMSLYYVKEETEEYLLKYLAGKGFDKERLEIKVERQYPQEDYLITAWYRLTPEEKDKFLEIKGLGNKI